MDRGNVTAGVVFVLLLVPVVAWLVRYVLRWT